MTKLLEDAIKIVRELPEDDQDEAAEMLMAIAARTGAPVALDDQTRRAIRAGREQARRGEFVSDADMAAFFARHGVKPKRA
jgi:predicted transcriptional regulator